MVKSVGSSRYLISIGYHGDAFHGSQIQPDVRTVEGSLVQALKRLKWWNKNCLELSSRTDSGVRVRMNLARIDLPSAVSSVIKEKSLVRALNDHLPVGMTVISASKVNQNSRVRLAYFRHYLYRLDMIEEWPENVSNSQISEVCSIFEGTHNFSNLSKFEEDKDPVRTVDECIPWIHSGTVIGFSIKAQSFLWNQVRRIASALSGIASGRISMEELKSALCEPEKKVDFGRAISDGLILWAINHPDFLLDEDKVFPSDNLFSIRTHKTRDYRRWISLCNFEMSSLIEREWLQLINSD